MSLNVLSIYQERGLVVDILAVLADLSRLELAAAESFEAFVQRAADSSHSVGKQEQMHLLDCRDPKITSIIKMNYILKLLRNTNT